MRLILTDGRPAYKQVISGFMATPLLCILILLSVLAYILITTFAGTLLIACLAIYLTLLGLYAFGITALIGIVDIWDWATRKN